MRVGILFLGILLLFSVPAGAQGPAGVGGGAPSGPRYSSLNEHQYDPWQVSLGYQYNRDNLLGSPFNTHGVNVDFVRFFGRWIGVEAQMGTGFLGTTGQTTVPPGLGVKSIYIGGGPRVAWRTRSRLEPWAHVTVGMEHFRFDQTAGILGSNSALAGDAGGGIDYFVKSHIAVRAEADFIGSRFFSTNQRMFQIVGGVVLGF